MTRITTEHNGRSLYMTEHDEHWHCSDMDMSASSLKALKAKITKFDGEAAKVSIPVLVMGHNSPPTPGMIVKICSRDDWEKNYSDRANPYPSVWITQIDGNKVKRTKKRLDELFARTPENLVAVETAVAKFKDAKRIEQEGRDLLRSLPRMTFEELAALNVTADEEPNK